MAASPACQQRAHCWWYASTRQDTEPLPACRLASSQLHHQRQTVARGVARGASIQLPHCQRSADRRPAAEWRGAQHIKIGQICRTAGSPLRPRRQPQHRELPRSSPHHMYMCKRQQCERQRVSMPADWHVESRRRAYCPCRAVCVRQRGIRTPWCL